MTKTTIVLGCSSRRRANLAPVVEVLVGRGNPVEVVSGIETSDDPWKDVIGRLGLRAVYVLCSDRDVNLQRVGELRRLLANASVPPGRTWCGPIDWAQPTQLLRNVEHLLGARAPAASPPAPPAAKPPLPGPPPAQPARRMSTMLAPPPAPSASPSEMSGTLVRPAELSTPRGRPPAPASHPLVDAEPSGRNWKPAAAIGGVLALALGVAIPVVASGDDSETASDAGISDQAMSVSAVAGVVADEALTEDVAEAEAPSEPDPATMDAAQAPPDTPEAVPADVVSDAGSSPGAPTPQAWPMGSPQERDVIFDALGNQEIRALDVLLVGPEAHTLSKRGHKNPARLKFDDAHNYCRDLSAGNIPGWRLPTAGELASLNDNRMLNRAVYWSETDGDTFGNNRVVFSTSKHQMRAKRRSYRGARTVCVRLISPKLAPLDQLE